MSKASINSLSQSFFEENSILAEKSSSQPGVYSGQFTASVIQDTYLDTSGWGKGQLFINGYNIGRYWPTAGPQVRIYIYIAFGWVHTPKSHFKNAQIDRKSSSFRRFLGIKHDFVVKTQVLVESMPRHKIC